MSVTVSGNSAVVCVEAEDDATVKIILTDVTDQCHITNCEKCLTPYCSSISSLLAILLGQEEENNVYLSYYYCEIGV